MNQHIEDLRKQTLNLVQSMAEAKGTKDAPTSAVIETWLASIEEEDIAGVAPEVLASAISQCFSEGLSGSPAGCRISALRYANSRDAGATALLIANPDMPFLVDSIVMAMRNQRVVSRAVLNAVLSVRRDAQCHVTHVERANTGKDPLESYVLCLLAEELAAPALANLVEAIKSVAGDAAAVHRDAQAMREKMKAVAAASAKQLTDGPEVSDFLEWAEEGGFELFGYAYYRAVPGEGKLMRDLPSRIGVLRDTAHPIYDKCLAGIPEDFATQSGRIDSLSIVKADTQSTLHRDQKLDFIGVRDVNEKGEMIGEHCFLGLFSRSAAVTPLAQLPFARGRIKQVLSIAGVRPEGFRAEKFLEILESLPRTEIMEATPEWLAELSGTVVALYKQPRAKVFARRDIYGRHLNVLVYMPRERYSASLAETLSQNLRNLAGAGEVTYQTHLAEGPLASLYLIAKGARAHLDLDGDIVRPLSAAIEGWHNAFDEMVDESNDPALRTGLRRLRQELPADYIAATSPRTAFHDLSMLGSLRSIGVKVHIELGWRGTVNVRLLSAESAPSLSQILPALHNAGVAVDREQTFTITGLDGSPFFVTCLTVDSASAAKLAQPHVAHAAQELFQSLFNNEAEDGRMNGLVIEAGLRQKEVQVMRAYASYWRQTGSRFSLRYIADCLRKQPAIVRTLVDSFAKRFDPKLSEAER
ncbi:MAG TPA: glutamate dehydrogenase, partial [Burkholderiaceae bacterium]